jgi:hypothetical protein
MENRIPHKWKKATATSAVDPFTNYDKLKKYSQKDD